MTTTPATEPTPHGAPASPEAGHTPRNDKPNPLFDKPQTTTDWVTRIILGAVMLAALAVGTWSVFTLLTVKFHVPEPVAYFGCGLFDGAALYFARLSQRYALTTDSGLAPRTAMLVMVCASSWVNWKHAELERWGTVGQVIFAAAPIIAELAFQMWHTYEHREALRRRGRVPQALPALGKWAWIAHPTRSRKVIDAHIKAGLTEHEAVAEKREEVAGERATEIVQGATVTLGRGATETPATGTAQIPVAAMERPALTPASATNTVPWRPATDTFTRHETYGAPTVVAPQTPATPRRHETSPHATAPATDQTPQNAAPRHHGPTPTPATVAPRPTPAKKTTTPSGATRNDAKNAIRALYDTLGRRPFEGEMVDELKRIQCAYTSRQFAQKLRGELEKDKPHLAALGTDNVRALTGTDG